MASPYHDALDVFVRKIAARVAVSPSGTFVGKAHVLDVALPLIPSSGAYGFSWIEIHDRLHALLYSGQGGLAQELDRRIREGTLWEISEANEGDLCPRNYGTGDQYEEDLERGGCRLTSTQTSSSPTVVAFDDLPQAKPKQTLPSAAQYVLLPLAQTIMEKTCYRYLESSCPEVLARNRWDCPEAAELSAYAREIQKYAPLGLGDLGESALRGLIDLRNFAVHRVLLDDEKLQGLLQHAAVVATVVGDYGAQIELKLLTTVFKSVVVEEEVFDEDLGKLKAERDSLNEAIREAEAAKEERRLQLATRLKAYLGIDCRGGISGTH